MLESKVRQAVHAAVMASIQPRTRAKLPELLNELMVPPAADVPEISKRGYIETRLKQLNRLDDCVCVGLRLLELHGETMEPERRFNLEELVWSATPTVAISRKTRYEIARALCGVELFIKSTPFLSLVQRLWSRDPYPTSFYGQGRGRMLDQVEQHLVRNDDWSAEILFEHLGAFEVSDRRFGSFLEGLAASDVRPDEASQREFASRVNSCLSGTATEFREVDTEGGFLVYRFVGSGQVIGRPKNLIFASPSKPDLRFRDAINNDIEVVTHADEVLVYDRPIAAGGLTWRDLQAWWADREGLDSVDAKQSLYSRLLAALPESSPPQRLLFEMFYKTFRKRVPELPALLPEVWLHWDSKTVRERGVHALLRFRMDFLILISPSIRVVIEVDGKQHYADQDRADPKRYAAMVQADRELRLAGYEVYRFGGSELAEDSGRKLAAEFFVRLFERHGLPG